MPNNNKDAAAARRRHQQLYSGGARRRRVLRPLEGETLVTMYDIVGTPLFPAVVADGTWNGAAIPFFRRDVAKLVVDWINATHAKNRDAARAHWDGDTVVLIEAEAEAEPGYTPERITPDHGGRYGIGARAWTWNLVDD